MLVTAAVQKVEMDIMLSRNPLMIVARAWYHVIESIHRPGPFDLEKRSRYQAANILSLAKTDLEREAQWLNQ